MDDVHRIPVHNSQHTGVFLSERRKIASIGVQVRHRLTTHGLAINITDEPIPWFDQVVACGLEDVRAVSLEAALGHAVTVENQAAPILDLFASRFKREMQPLDDEQAQIMSMIRDLQAETEHEGPWLRKPAGVR